MEQIEIDNWKGKDEIEIEKTTDGFNIIEHRKDKDTLEIKEIKRFVPLTNVIRVLKIIDNNDTDKLTYKELAKKIIDELNLNIELNAWNGGENRAKFYFPLHYYPLKILEKKGKILYSGRGNITRLGENIK